MPHDSGTIACSVILLLLVASASYTIGKVNARAANHSSLCTLCNKI